MTTGPRTARATFWLLEAPDSLTRQSRMQPDGTGLGWFDEDGMPFVDKAPIPAFEDELFWCEARSIESQSFLAHVRFASTGGLSPQNTHPFEQAGRLLAHNGVIEDLPKLEAELGDSMELVAGETDSERFFALVTKRIAEHGGDVGRGLAAAARWAAAELPLHAINVILVSGSEVWALRYPETHDLFMLERPAGGSSGDHDLDHASSAGRMRVHSGDLAGCPSVVFATERMDEDPGWRNLEPGELVHVGADLVCSSEIALPDPPKHFLTRDDLTEQAAASQAEG
jgi:glutamine amidotransferase